MDMRTSGDADAESRRSERLLMVSVVLALGLMVILLVLCLSDHLSWIRRASPSGWRRSGASLPVHPPL